MIEDNSNGLEEWRERHRRRQEEDKTLPLRNVLNTIFLLGAVVGLVIFFTGDQNTGKIIVMVAMVFKMAEAAFRFFKH